MIGPTILEKCNEEIYKVYNLYVWKYQKHFANDATDKKSRMTIYYLDLFLKNLTLRLNLPNLLI